MHSGYVHVEVAFLVGTIWTIRARMRLLASMDECVPAQQLALVLAAEYLTTDFTGKATCPAWGHPTYLQYKHRLQRLTPLIPNFNLVPFANHQTLTD